MVFNDCTYKPKLPIFRLIITIYGLNIFIILLLSETSTTISSTYLGVKFYGVSSLGPSFDDTTLYASMIFGQPLKVFLLLTLIYFVIPKLELAYEHWMVVWFKPHVVFEDVVVTNSYVFIMYVHLIHHHDELPSMYDNHIGHLLHHVMHAIVVLELLLPIVVIYFSFISSIVANLSFVASVMSCFLFVF